MPVISICICTFRRPEGLRKLLESLQKLDPGTPSVEVIVVDNDARGSGASVIDAVRTTGLAIKYCVEPVQGIARARSRAFHAATGEFVAFIDDDEEADPMWLVTLWRELVAQEVTGVIGRIVPRFACSPPPWLGQFLSFPQWPTGTVLAWYHTRTSNALVRRESIARHAGPFDRAYDLTGGEDCELFARMIDDGATFVAAESAIVYEDVPPKRVTTRQVIVNHLVDGQIYVRVQFRSQRFLALLPHLVRAVVLGGVYVVAGAVVTPVSRARGFRAILRSASQWGIVSGGLGILVHKYRSQLVT